MTSVTVNTVALVLRLREKFPSVQVPSAAVVHVRSPLWWLNVPLTVALATALPVEFKTLAVTFGCHLNSDEAAVVTLSRSPM